MDPERWLVEVVPAFCMRASNRRMPRSDVGDDLTPRRAGRAAVPRLNVRVHPLLAELEVGRLDVS